MKDDAIENSQTTQDWGGNMYSIIPPSLEFVDLAEFETETLPQPSYGSLRQILPRYLMPTEDRKCRNNMRTKHEK